MAFPGGWMFNHDDLDLRRPLESGLLWNALHLVNFGSKRKNVHLAEPDL